MKTKPAPEEVLPVTAFVADLDDDRVYHGVIEKHREDVTERDVEVPKDCDLEAGMYRWDWNQRAFVPLLEKFRARNQAAKAARAELLGRKDNPRGRVRRP